MLKGHLDMIVLAALSAGPAHGYAVIEEIRRKSGRAFDLSEGDDLPRVAPPGTSRPAGQSLGDRRNPGDGGGSTH